MNRALVVPQTHMRYTGPEMNRTLELDLAGMNRVLAVTLTHRSYTIGSGTNRALGVPQTHVRYTGPEMNRALVVTQTHVSYIPSSITGHHEECRFCSCSKTRQ
jgi:hypothetical protein